MANAVHQPTSRPFNAKDRAIASPITPAPETPRGRGVADTPPGINQPPQCTAAWDHLALNCHVICAWSYSSLHREHDIPAPTTTASTSSVVLALADKPLPFFGPKPRLETSLDLQPGVPDNNAIEHV